MTSFYDDNYGKWDIEDEEDLEHYYKVQRENITKTCIGCGQQVHIKPEYDVCNSCAEARERGADF